MPECVTKWLLDGVVEKQAATGSWMFTPGYPEVHHALELDALALKHDGVNTRRLEYALRATAYLCSKKAQDQGVLGIDPSCIYTAPFDALSGHINDVRLRSGERLVLNKLRRQPKTPVDPLRNEALSAVLLVTPLLIEAASTHDHVRLGALLIDIFDALRLPPTIIIKFIHNMLQVK